MTNDASGLELIVENVAKHKGGLISECIFISIKYLINQMTHQFGHLNFLTN